MSVPWSLFCAVVWAPLFVWLFQLFAVIVPWAKVELIHGCNTTHYVLMQHGACDTINQKSKGFPSEHCIGWGESSDWKALDEQSDGDTHFASDAKNDWEAVQVLAWTSFAAATCYVVILREVERSCSTEDSSDCTIFAYPFLLPLFPCSLAAFIMAMNSSQLSADDWEDATGCDVRFTWLGGMPCMIVALAFSSWTCAYLVCGRVPEVIRKMPWVRNDRFGGMILLRPEFAAQAIGATVASESSRSGIRADQSPPTTTPAPTPAAAPEPTPAYSDPTDTDIPFVVPPPSYRANV